MTETTLGKSDAVWLARNFEELEQSLPEPGRTWRWSDTSLSHACLSQLQQRNLIVKLNGEWRTTRQLWEALEQYAGAETEELGETTGQETISHELPDNSPLKESRDERLRGTNQDATRQALLERFLDLSDSDQQGKPSGSNSQHHHLHSQRTGSDVDEQ